MNRDQPKLIAFAKVSTEVVFKFSHRFEDCRSPVFIEFEILFDSPFTHVFLGHEEHEEDEVHEDEEVNALIYSRENSSALKR